MTNFRKTRKTLAILLSILMIVLTLNVSTVSAYSNELNDNIQIADTAQVNIIDGNGNVVEQTTTQPTTVQETQPVTEKETEQVTQEETQPPTQEATEKATVEVNKNETVVLLDIANGSILIQTNGANKEYKQGDGEWTTYVNEISITGTTTSNTVTVLSGEHTINLSNLNIDVSNHKYRCAFDIDGDSIVNLNLLEGTNNSLKSGENRAAIQVEARYGHIATVNIDGSGALDVIAGEYGAGIGGELYSSAGIINIDGGVINAEMNYHCSAGIGSGYKGTSIGEISISGGTITAFGGGNSAGIGGGYMGEYGDTSGTINITGGTIHATGGGDGAAIGSGRCDGINYIKTNISGGIITAISGILGDGNSAAIGGGFSSSGGEINITGDAKITAVSGGDFTYDENIENAYGIGSGGYTSRFPRHGSSTITIGENAEIISVSSHQYAIENSNGTISKPTNEDFADIIQVSYKEILSGNSKTTITDGANKTFTYTPEREYKSIAFSGVNPGDTYYALLEDVYQQGIDKNNVTSTKFTVSSGLNNFTSLTSTPHNITLSISDSNIYFRKIGYINEYSKDNNTWTEYSGNATISGTTKTNSVKVLSGELDIILNNVDIDVSERSKVGAFDIQGTSIVNLTLAQNTTNILKSGKYQAGLQVETKNGNTASVNIKGSGNLSATGGFESAGIGGSSRISAGNILISDNAIVTANGGGDAAGIGGGYYASGGTISISGNAAVTATGGNRLNDGYYYPTAIGSGGYHVDYPKPNGATLSIGSNTTVIAISQGDIAIDDDNNTLDKPDGEELADILELTYTNIVEANKVTSISDGQSEILSLAPSTSYKSIAFTGLDTNKIYVVNLDGEDQQGTNESNEISNVFILTNALNKYTSVMTTPVIHNPELKVDENNYYLRTDNNNKQFSINNISWTSYTGDITISGVTTENTIISLSGEHNVILNNVNIDVSAKNNISPFDIQGTSIVNLSLSENSINILNGGSNSAGIQVQSIDNTTASVNIMGSGKLTVTGGINAAAIGGGYNHSGGSITISENPTILALGGNRDNSGYIYSSAIGCGAYLNNVAKPTGATLSIGNNAKVTAVSYGNTAIDARDHIISNPNGEEKANIIHLSYEFTVSANVNTTVTDNIDSIFSYSPETEYKSIAFSGLDTTKTYNVLNEQKTQYGKNNEGVFSLDYTINSGLNNYSNLIDSPDKLNINESNIYFRTINNFKQYSRNNKTWTYYYGDVTISGDTTENSITVLSGTHDIILDGVNIDLSLKENRSAFDIQGTSTANITLAEDSQNILKSGTNCAGIQVKKLYSQNATVNIIGSGSLETTGGSQGAGIGGGYYEDGGSITIGSNATITSTGGKESAGIGGGFRGNGGIININGTAQVTSTGGSGGAGIGSAKYGEGGGVITISNTAQVTANGGSNGAGIGSGLFSENETIIIKDNAQVTATGGIGGAGIGGGFGSSGIISITNNALVTATGGNRFSEDYYYPTAIGSGGYEKNTVKPEGATITIGAQTTVTAVSSSDIAIDAIGDTINKPDDEEVANIINLTYKNIVSGDTTVTNGVDSVFSYTQDTEYKSIAFSGLELNEDYDVFNNNDKQIYIEDSNEIDTFTIKNNGINNFKLVQYPASYNPNLNLINGSIELRNNNGLNEYKQGTAENWITYFGTVTITQSNYTSRSTTNTITVQSGDHDILLNGININVLFYNNVSAFDIQGSSAITLTLAEGSKNTLISGSNAAGLQVQTAAVSIKGSGELIANGGSQGAGIGGGASGNGGTISISETVKVTATGGLNGAGIGGGANGNGATLSIGSNAVVTAVSNGDIAIDAINNTISSPSDEEIANIILLTYKNKVDANKETIVTDNNDSIFSYAPKTEYNSIAFSGVKLNGEYNVYNDTIKQTFLDNETFNVTFSIVNSGINIFNSVQVLENLVNLDLINGNIEFRGDDNSCEYRQGEESVWVAYKGSVTISQSNYETRYTNYTITVESGTHDIILNGVHIYANNYYSAPIKISGSAIVNLSLPEGVTNTVKGSSSEGIQLESIIDEETIPTVNIIGGGKIIASASYNNPGIGGRNRFYNGSISISDNAQVIATGGDGAAGIGGGSDTPSGTISISGNAQVTATGGGNAPGIGSGIHNITSSGSISISDNAQVTATGKYNGAGIGGGMMGNCGAISITGNAQVTAIADGNGSGIGSDMNGSTGTISIGSNAKVIAQSSYGLAIDAIDNTITKPLDEEVANVLELTYARIVYPNTKTVITAENAKVIEHLSETANYKSIAFSGLDLDTTYKVITGDNYQQGTLNSVTTDNFELSTTGLTKYTNVQNTANQARKVTFTDSTNDAVIGEAYTTSGGDVNPPKLPLLRKENYSPTFNASQLQNITEDTTLTYDRVLKSFDVASGIILENPDEMDNLTLSQTSANYDDIVRATYTGVLEVKGWKINDKIVSVTSSKIYAFYVTEDSTITPIFGNDITSVNINIGTVSYSTETDVAKLYYPIITSGYEDGTNIRYGVIRSTTQADVTEAKIAEYLADDTKETNANIVKEYTDTNVMNGDGRYNYVAVMPKNTDKSLYMQAWIEVDGTLYLTTLNEQNMSTID